MKRYPPDDARREVALIAAGLHWSYESLMSMDHAERRHWARIVSRPATGRQ